MFCRLFPVVCKHPPCFDLQKAACAPCCTGDKQSHKTLLSVAHSRCNSCTTCTWGSTVPQKLPQRSHGRKLGADAAVSDLKVPLAGLVATFCVCMFHLSISVCLSQVIGQQLQPICLHQAPQVHHQKNQLSPSHHIQLRL